MKLSQIPNDRELCVDVQFDREYHVGVVQAVPINVYDYYEPGQIIWIKSFINIRIVLERYHLSPYEMQCELSVLLSSG